jgi:hypothetical protein
MPPEQWPTRPGLGGLGYGNTFAGAVAYVVMSVRRRMSLPEGSSVKIVNGLAEFVVREPSR